MRPGLTPEARSTGLLGRGVPGPLPLILILALAAVFLAVAAFLRSAEYDEGYSLLLAAGTVRPAWPEAVFVVGEVRGIYEGRASLSGIFEALRGTDVHPPLYFWLL